MKQFRLLTLLALLMTAATGAWAEDGIVCTASDLGKVLCTDGSIVATVSDATAASKTAAAMIAYVDETNKKGLALALADDYGYQTWTDITSHSPAVTGGTWVLASETQWTQMITAMGSDGLRDGFSSIGGTNLENDYYWSSTAGASGHRRYAFDSKDWYNSNPNSGKAYGRACLVFDIVEAPAGPTSYTVSMKSGTQDADKWTITPTEATTTGILENTEVTLQYNGRLKVKGVKATSDAAPAANPNAYLKWDATKKELVEAEIPAGATTVTNADAGVNWTAGTYVVEGEVTINGNIYLTGNVDLIIKDGAKLTANRINSPNNDKKNLSIYGQSKMNGELFINTTSFYAIDYLNTLEVHSCKVTAYCTNSGGIFAVETINVYGGLLDAKYTGSDGYGIFLSGGGKMNIYGGEVKAASNGTGTNSYGIMASTYDSAITVTVYGGKLWAESPGKTVFNTAKTTFTKDAGYTSGKIETSDDGSSWTEWTTEGTPSTKYVRVGY